MSGTIRVEQGYLIELNNSPEKDPSSLYVYSNDGQYEQKDQPHDSENNPESRSAAYQDTPIHFTGATVRTVGVDSPNVPPKIFAMRKLYQYGSDSFQEKCQNFYRQGKFMEDYEDNMPWAGAYRQYFPTYHDLNVRQLRGYFTWRKFVRKGDFRPISASYAYLYLYELLNGIGTSSPEDSLQKMKAFEQGFIMHGFGDVRMKNNLDHWMFEFAVMHGCDAAETKALADSGIICMDQALAVLREYNRHTDSEVTMALDTLCDGKLLPSPIFKKAREKGISLFAAVWRRAASSIQEQGKDFFTLCFDMKRKYVWHPLANALYWEQYPHGDQIFQLDESRTYFYHDGVWRVICYEKLYFDKTRFRSLIHATDCLLRRYLKTGSYLREKAGDAWAIPLVKAVIQQDQEEAAEAAKPKISIDFSHLDQIREDADITRDSLLVDEEDFTADVGTGDNTVDFESTVSQNKTGVKSEPGNNACEIKDDSSASEQNPDSLSSPESLPGLDALHTTILRDLLTGQSPDSLIRENHLMPSIVADTINEALFDEIGDSVLECNDDKLTLIEDYREDVQNLFTSTTQ